MNISRVAVFKKVKKGQIKARRFGKAYAVSASEAAGFVAEKEESRYGDIAVFKQETGATEIHARLKNNSVWLNLNQISGLFDRDKGVISRHISNVYDEGELDRDATVAKFATVQREGGKEVERVIEYYNLDMIISVGYRVKSRAGVQFRIWATNTLKEYMLRGYAINERLLAEEHVRYNGLRKVVDSMKKKTSL
ncbi:MAG TPA: hypothetical protein ENN43_02490 [bacterium]|nr:hypothetical protein [bacterium]